MSAGVVLASEAMRAKIADQRRLSTPLRDYAVFRSTRNGMEWRSRGGATTRWSTAHSTGSALTRGLLSHAQPRVSSSGPSAHGSSTVAHLWAGGAGSSGSSLGLYPLLTSAGPRRHGATAKAASYPSGARGCEGWGLFRGVGVFERAEQWARAALSAGAPVCRPAFPPAAPLVFPQRHRLVGVAAERGQTVRHHALRRPLARPLRMQDLQPGAVAPSGWGEGSATA